MINYIFSSLIGLGASLLVYRLLLKSQKSFHFNRYFLLATLVLALLAPVVDFNFGDHISAMKPMHFVSQPTDNLVMLPLETSMEVITKSKNNLTNIFLCIYLGIAVILFGRFIFNLLKIIKLTKSSTAKIGNLKVVLIKDSPNVSSFFNFLFINPKMLEISKVNDDMIIHESIHAQQWHSVDVLLCELLSCIFWFNPFVWFYKYHIRENHEFLVDDAILLSGRNVETYSQTIISSGDQAKIISFSSAFNFNHIKTRLLMLHTSKSSFASRSVKALIAVSLFTALFTLTSFKDNHPQLVVVIDAGHGGHDYGNFDEKEIVLQISEKLAAYGNQKIKFIQTRSSDDFISLKERVNIINAQQPDLVISLHCNASDDSRKRGVEAYYYNENDYQKQSYNYGKLIVENQLREDSESGQLKTAGFYILKNIDTPGIVLELGFLTNPDDKALLLQNKQQEFIAKSIYESLLEIRKNK